MTTEEQTEPTTIPHIAIEVEVRFPVHVSVDRLQEIGGDGVLTDSIEAEQAAREAIDENPDILEEAFREFREGMGDYTVDDLTLTEREPVKRWAMTERADLGHEFYTEPAPNLRPGLMNFGEDGITFVTESPLSKLTDEQVRGGHGVANMIWQTVTLGRRERESLMPVLAELNWIMLARPTLHKSDGAEVCALCNQAADLHPAVRDAAVDGDTV